MNTSNDTTVTKFLQQAEDDIAVTKYLMDMLLEAQLEGDGVNQYLDTTVTKFMAQQEDDIAITKYLGTSSAKFLEAAKESAKLNDAT